MVKKEDLENIVDCEGLGYAVMNYYNSEDFDNKTLQSLWVKAGNILHDLDDWLYRNKSDKGKIKTFVLKQNNSCIIVNTNIPKEMIKNIDTLEEFALKNDYFFEKVDSELINLGEK